MCGFFSRFSSLCGRLRIFTWLLKNLIARQLHSNYSNTKNEWISIPIEIWFEIENSQWIEYKCFCCKNARNSMTIELNFRFLGLPLTSAQVMVVVSVALTCELSLSFSRLFSHQFSPHIPRISSNAYMAHIHTNKHQHWFLSYIKQREKKMRMKRSERQCVGRATRDSSKR